MPIRLYVKGDKFHATRSAARHGVKLAHVQPHRRAKYGGGIENVVAETSCAAGVKVRRWFGEDTRAPHPPGALLYFRERCGGLSGARRRKRR